MRLKFEPSKRICADCKQSFAEGSSALAISCDPIKINLEFSNKSTLQTATVRCRDLGYKRRYILNII